MQQQSGLPFLRWKSRLGQCDGGTARELDNDLLGQGHIEKLMTWSMFHIEFTPAMASSLPRSGTRTRLLKLTL